MMKPYTSTRTNEPQRYPLSMPKEQPTQCTPNRFDTSVENTYPSSIKIFAVPVTQDVSLSDHDVHLLHTAHHKDPFGVLGPHVCRYIDTEEVAQVMKAASLSAVELGEVPTESGAGVVTPSPTFEKIAAVNAPVHVKLNKGSIVVRTWIKDSATVEIRFKGQCASDEWFPLTSRANWLHEASFTWVTDRVPPVDGDLLSLTSVNYECRVQYHGTDTNTYIINDAYQFHQSLSSEHLKLFQSGSCWHVDSLLGSHRVELKGVSGFRFAVWAPNAQFVSVVSDFNQWDGRAHPMRKRHEFGVWELFIADVPQVGMKYMYKIHTPQGTDIIKIDPYAQEYENPPAYASVLTACDDAYKAESDRYQWRDSDWMVQRAENAEIVGKIPMSIYEVHLPSWMRGDNNSYLSYKELAHRLVEHCKKLNFTHVEFLPLHHHPFEGSWGYQVSGLYAPYSRLGSADDLKFLIDELHLNGIGVYLDFVAAHFVKDDWGLRHYDGVPCFEYADPREGELKGWGTMAFNYGRSEVRCFILGAAYHWLRRYHIDGLRIDAVSAMLYKNYCRPDGEWVPNAEGGDANLEAISLLQELNWVAHKEFPGVFMMAEEATSWRGVTDKQRGLGFDAKWDLGWMNDTLAYLCTPGIDRSSKYNKLTFRGLYAGHENWILPLSHDEVVSGKGSLLDKCAFKGTSFEERLANMKTLMVYQMTLCGRPLLFMGAEFGQGREWKESRSLDWHEAEEPARGRYMTMVADLLGLYKELPPLHAGVDEPHWHFKWLICEDYEKNVVAYVRSYGKWYDDVVVLINFGGLMHHHFKLALPHRGAWKVLLNTDDWKYGGSMRGRGNGTQIDTENNDGLLKNVYLDLAPFSAYILQYMPTPEDIKKTEYLEECARRDAMATNSAVEATKSAETSPKAVSAVALKTEVPVGDEKECTTSGAAKTQVQPKVSPKPVSSKGTASMNAAVAALEAKLAEDELSQN